MEKIIKAIIDLAKSIIGWAILIFGVALVVSIFSPELGWQKEAKKNAAIFKRALDFPAEKSPRHKKSF